MPRPRKPKPKRIFASAQDDYLSDGTSFTISTPMHMQLVRRVALSPGSNKTDHILWALEHFLDAQPRSPLSKPVLRNPPANPPKRDLLVSFKYTRAQPNLRLRLSQYADKHRLSVSSICRRALYEYMKDDLESLSPETQVRAAFDGWGDPLITHVEPDDDSKKGEQTSTPTAPPPRRGRPYSYEHIDLDEMDTLMRKLP